MRSRTTISLAMEMPRGLCATDVAPNRLTGWAMAAASGASYCWANRRCRASSIRPAAPDSGPRTPTSCLRSSSACGARSRCRSRRWSWRWRSQPGGGAGLAGARNVAQLELAALGQVARPRGRSEPREGARFREDDDLYGSEGSINHLLRLWEYHAHIAAPLRAVRRLSSTRPTNPRRGVHGPQEEF